MIGLVKRRAKLPRDALVVATVFNVIKETLIGLPVLRLVPALRPECAVQSGYKFLVVLLVKVGAGKVRFGKRLVNRLAVKATALRFGERFQRVRRLRALPAVGDGADALHHERKVGRVRVDRIAVRIVQAGERLHAALVLLPPFNRLVCLLDESLTFRVVLDHRGNGVPRLFSDVFNAGERVGRLSRRGVVDLFADTGLHAREVPGILLPVCPVHGCRRRLPVHRRLGRIRLFCLRPAFFRDGSSGLRILLRLSGFFLLSASLFRLFKQSLRILRRHMISFYRLTEGAAPEMTSTPSGLSTAAVVVFFVLLLPLPPPPDVVVLMPLVSVVLVPVVWLPMAALVAVM